MATKTKPSWIAKKLSDPNFRESFEVEYEKLSVGEQIARLRISAKLTQEELAKKIGTTASAISRYENAEYDRYEIQTLRKIAEACGAKLKIVFEDGKRGRVA
jgi:ribosome-binding protein aMBF1 (putative translation factor)